MRPYPPHYTVNRRRSTRQESLQNMACLLCTAAMTGAPAFWGAITGVAPLAIVAGAITGALLLAAFVQYRESRNLR